jgi:hypothetical protein
MESWRLSNLAPCWSFNLRYLMGSDAFKPITALSQTSVPIRSSRINCRPLGRPKRLMA